MNELFVMLGIETWKPVLAALLLPPVPLLLLMLVGARMILWRRGLGWLVVILSVAGLWLSASTEVATWIERAALKPPRPLDGDRIAELKRSAAAGHTAVVVLGGGREALAPEYGMSNLQPRSLERLRYGIWLSRETGAPLAFSGGTGHGQSSGAPEAEIASRIASREFGRPLKWVEAESRDTRENAARTIALLKPAGVRQVLLVTHGFHMPRSWRAFQQASERNGGEIEIIAAPMGLATGNERPVLRWLPSSEGLAETRQVLRELAGLWSGA